MHDIVANKRKKLNLIYKLIGELTHENESDLVHYCYEKGDTFEQIAKALRITRSALQQRYPDLAKEGKRENA